MEVNGFINKKRFIVFVSFLAIFLLLLILQFSRYMLFRELKVLSPSVITTRGDIYDRNKKILAMQTKLYNLCVNKDLIKNDVEMARIISPVIHLEEDKIIEKIRDSSSNFVYIKKRISETEKEELLASVEANEIEGVSVAPLFNRIYPEDTLASTVIGFLGDDGRGLTGVEYSLQKVLSPPANTEGYDGIGYNVYLSIDRDIQHIMEQRASKVMQETNCEGLMFLAVDAKTGGVLGYVSAPSPSLANFTSSKDEERLDRPANFIYEPGSVFKIFSLASFLELGATFDGDEYLCDMKFDFKSANNKIKIPPIKCLRSHGRVTPKDIIKVSCNDGIAQIADKVDSKSFYNKLLDFGFGSRTGINLPGETPGLLNMPESWSVRTKHTIAMGQEIGVSALQIVQAATAIANDGNMLRLSLVYKVEDKDEDAVYVHSPQVIRRVISSETAHLILDYMQAASKEGGTGWRASIKGVPIAVKTGTAQMANKNRMGYSDEDFVASCIGIFPKNDPKIILYLACVRPRGDTTYGELIAAPAISDVASAIIDHLGFSRDNAKTIGHTGRIPIEDEKEIELIGSVMPNLKGKSKKQLLNLLNNPKYKVSIEGDGYVYRQVPSEGVKLNTGDKIELYLK